MLTLAVLLLALQEGEVDRILLKFQQRRALVGDASGRLLADTRTELERFIKEHPRHKDVPRAAFHAAETFVWGRDAKQALERFEAFVRDFPTSELAAAARFVRGELLLQLEEDARARDAFQEFVRLHPKDERVFYARCYVAITLQNEGKYDEAASLLLDAREQFRDRAESWSALMQLAIVYHVQERHPDARRTLEEIVRGTADRGTADIARRHLSEYLKVGQDAPGFEEKDAVGTEFSLARQRGKVVVLYFFDPGAPAAENEAGFLKRTAEALKGKDLEFMGVCVGLDRQEFQIYKGVLKIEWPLFFDGKAFDGKIPRLYDVRALPALTVIDRKGKIRFFNLAGRDLRHALERLLGEK